MQRIARQILLTSLLALYGVVTVLGPALHALPGAEHAKAGTPVRWNGSDSTSTHDDCPVCHFLTLGQLAVDPAPVLFLDEVRIPPADGLPLTFPPVESRSAGPRAPPLA